MTCLLCSHRQILLISLSCYFAQIGDYRGVNLLKLKIILQQVASGSLNEIHLHSKNFIVRFYENKFQPIN